MAKLKPCPACKRLPNLEYSDEFGIFENKRYFRFACCGIAAEASEYTSEAIEAWNKRVGDKNE